jgi:mono/diheme cytochrome c family protein
MGALMKAVLVSGSFVLLAASGASAQPAATPNEAPARAVVNQYCVSCHNDKLQSGGVSLARLDFDRVENEAELAEKMIRKLRAGLMPPAGARRPPTATLDAVAAALESALDAAAAANPSPGRPALHRLNRFEYANSVRDLLALDIDPATLLPPDDSSHGFDNMAEVLNMSPTLMEGYVRAAGKISRAALGDPRMSAIVDTYHIPQSFSQTDHVPGTPFGTRGGLVARHNFPMDGEYIFKMSFYYSSIGPVFGASQEKGAQKVEVAVNGERVALLEFNPDMKVSDDLRTPPIRIKAGPQTISVSFLSTFSGPVEDFVMPFQQALADLSTGHIAGLTALPHLRDVGIAGPYNATGVGDTPSRRKILVCRPKGAADEIPCARNVIATLARQAYRRPVNAGDVDGLMKLYRSGRVSGDFESGIRVAVQAIVADPQFVFRFERTPANVAAGTNFRVTDVELASRLSYFLWSSAPDASLLQLAAQRKLREPAVLDEQVRRMMADPRAQALATNFAEQWLGLRNLDDLQPDVYLFPDWDHNLTRSMRRETQLFFSSIMSEDRDVTDLLKANYTFIDERLAKHYGIPNITGSRFRRVTVTDETRYGLLGQASVLTATSLANRTSPVSRGKWILEQILGVKAPVPPPNVPALKENTEGVKPLTVRDRLEQHRRVEPCASCHKIMDPLGFALEGFDAVGARRVRDGAYPIDASGQLYDGTKVDGPVSLRRALVDRSDVFVRNFTQNLLTYALGRGVEYYDMPAVRSIARNAAANQNRFSSLVLGIVNSVPFQMRRAEEVTTETAADAGRQPQGVR